MKTACQILLLVVLLWGLLRLLYEDINGKPARPPLGFKGVLGTLIAIAFLFFTYWKAGAFSTLFGGDP